MEERKKLAKNYIEVWDLKIPKYKIAKVLFNISGNFVETEFYDKKSELLCDFVEEIIREEWHQLYWIQLLEQVLYDI